MNWDRVDWFVYLVTVVVMTILDVPMGACWLSGFGVVYLCRVFFR